MKKIILTQRKNSFEHVEHALECITAKLLVHCLPLGNSADRHHGLHLVNKYKTSMLTFTSSRWMMRLTVVSSREYVP